MIEKGKVKKVFPGANTYKGFFSYYDNIVDLDVKRYFILKGGPGVGKSSFMKKIADEMLDIGYDIEYHQCSSDNNSIDGIKIPALNIAIIDGTAPHIVDPKYPGAIDEILYLGDFWDEEGLKENRKEIVIQGAMLGKLYKRVYRFINAAKSIRDDMEIIYKEALDNAKFNTAIRDLKEEIFIGIPYKNKVGKTRRLFGSAYAPGGIVDYYETIIGTMNKVIYINSCYVEGTSTVLEEIHREAISLGLFVEVFHEPMVETNMETILIPELDLAITSSKKYNINNIMVIDIDALMDKNIIQENEKILNEDRALVDDLIQRGLNNVLVAKKEHDILEKYYFTNMNFKKNNDLREKVLNKILKYAKEMENQI